MTEKRDDLDALLVEAASLALERPRLPYPADDEPEDELILRYLDADLPPLAREETRQRIQRTELGRERLAVLREAMAEAREEGAGLEPGPGQPLRLAFLLAADGLRFLFGAITPTSLVALPVATRGRVTDAMEESTFFDFVHSFGGIEVTLLVERVPGDRLDVQLQVNDDTTRTNPLRVNLSDANGILLDSQPVEQGCARFASLPPVPHRIAISESRREIGQLFLDVHSA